MLAHIEEFSKELLAEMAEEYPELRSWRFAWMDTKSAMGRCDYGSRKIELSRILIPAVKDESKIIDTLLHEIAHALAGVGNGHNYVWKNWCVKIGANPQRCYEQHKEVDISKVDFKYTYECPNCGRTGGFSRRWKHTKACGQCCKAHGGGYQERFKLIVTQNY
jgi:predicted SprT family Zn-dependent metalloprotease